MLYKSYGRVRSINSVKMNWALVRDTETGQMYSVYPVPNDRLMLAEKFQIMRSGDITKGQTYRHLPQGCEGMFEEVES